MNDIRLHYGLKSFIIAKDSARGYHLKGGLGALGVGQMWFKTEDKDREDPEYQNAPEESCEGGFGFQTRINKEMK